MLLTVKEVPNQDDYHAWYVQVPVAVIPKVIVTMACWMSVFRGVFLYVQLNIEKRKSNNEEKQIWFK